MSYEKLTQRINEEAEQHKQDAISFIANGYMHSWAEEHRTNPDRGIEKYSTPAKWAAYQVSKIDREKAIEFATKRAIKEVEKITAEKLEKLNRVANAPDLDFISVSVDWVRSHTWGYNPHSEVRTNTGIYYGSASGCGYDKESAAVAGAFNSYDSILKALYTLKENGLKAGKTDTSATVCTGFDNRNICGYGSGYSVLPYFEGGVGVSCFWPILKRCGFNVTEYHNKHSDFYTISKEF